MALFLPSRIRSHPWRWGITLLIAVLLGLGAALALRSRPPEYVTAIARRGELVQTVEAVGTVISEKDLALQFRSPGIVEVVLVREGETVGAGQTLARLRAGNLWAAVASAAARVQEREANLRLLREGTRPEEIAVAEAELQSRKAALRTAEAALRSAEEALKASQIKLEALRKEANVSIGGQVDIAGITGLQRLTTAEQSLASVDDVFANNDVEDAVERAEPSRYATMVGMKNTARSAILELETRPIPGDVRDAILFMQQVSSAIRSAEAAITAASDLIAILPETAHFTSSRRETYKSTLAAKRSAIQAALSEVDSWINTLRDAVAGYDTRIRAEEAALESARGAQERAESAIRTEEATVRIQEAQLTLKRSGARPADIAAAEARVRQAKADLAGSRADFSDTILTSPVSGTVTRVHGKPGELAPAGPAVEMVGASPLRIEMVVSDIDVPRLQASQGGSIELDAFRSTHFRLRVSEVDTSATEKDGIARYRVKLDFVSPHEEIKVGMTGDVTVTTGRKEGVVIVPSRAMLEEDKGPFVRILREDGTVEERNIETGMEGEGGMVEVTGVREGETVILLEKR